MTVTANVEANSYEIVYDANLGNGTLPNTSAVYDTAIALNSNSNSDNTIHRTGYNFLGWSTEDDSFVYTNIENLGDVSGDTEAMKVTNYLINLGNASGIYLYNGTYYAFNLTAEEDDSQTVYAQWQAITYDVSIDEQNRGATTVNDLTDVPFDTAKEIVGGETLTRPGYTLAGFDLDGNLPAGFTDLTSLITDESDISDEQKVTNYLINLGNASGGIYKYNNKYYVFNLATTDINVTVYAVWTPSNSTYRVEYYLELLDGTYVRDDNLKGTDLENLITTTNTKVIDSITGEEVSIPDVSYTGFHYEENPVGEGNENVLSGTVTGDGDILTLKRYYSRNTYTAQVLESITPSESGITGITSVSGSMQDGSLISYKYNQPVTINMTLKDGYTFAGLTENDAKIEEGVVSEGNTVTYTFNIIGNRVLTINLTRSQYALTINHMFETLTGEYESLTEHKAETDNTLYVDHVVTEQDIQGYVKSDDEILGYTFADFELNGAVITTDGNASVTIKYDRKSYTLTLEQNNTGVESLVAKENEFVTYNTQLSNTNARVYDVVYGAEDILLTYTLASGYTFTEWAVSPNTVTIDNGSTVGTGTISSMPAEAVNVEVHTEAGRVNFKINYYLQNLDGTFGTKNLPNDSDTTQTWYVDRNIENIIDPDSKITLKTFSGFRFDSFDDETIIKAPVDNGDGTYTYTEIAVYYVRESITVNVVLGEGVQSVTLSTNNTVGGEVTYTLDRTTATTGSINIIYGATVTLTQTAMAGYTFTNYTLTYGETTSTVTANFTVPSEVATLTANAEPQVYTVILNAQNDEGESDGMVNIYLKYNRGWFSDLTCESAISEITIPEHLGYTFAGYYTSGDTLIIDREGKIVAGNLTFTTQNNTELSARWTANTYTLIYNGNEGTGNDGNITSATFEHGTPLTYDTAVALRTDITWSRDGHTMIGWALTPSKINEVTPIEDLSTEVGDTTIDKVTNYLIRTDAEGGIYLYQGVYYAFNLAPKGSTTIYVVWDENTYNIVYHANNEITPEQTYTDSGILYTQNVTILAETNENFTFAKKGYHFDGWKTEEGDTLRPGNEVSMLTGEDNGNYDLYAIWVANTYSITFDKNAEDASGSTQGVTAIYDEATPLTTNNFTRTAYDFDGWTTVEGGQTSKAQVISLETLPTEEDRTDAEVLTEYLRAQSDASGIYLYNGTYYAFNLTSENNGSDILYAVWKATTYYITYSAGEGGSFNEDISTQVEYTVEETVSIYNNSHITRAGHRLIGFTITQTDQQGSFNWRTKYPNGVVNLTFTDENDLIGSHTTEAGLYGNVTLTAIWEALSYTVTVNYIYGDDCADSVKGTTYDTVSDDFVYNTTFRFTSPDIIGYNPTKVEVESPENFSLTSQDASEVRGTTPASDVVINVYYSPEEYVLTFNYNKAYGTTGEVTELAYTSVKVKYGFTYGAAITNDENSTPVGLAEPSREGYSFVNWTLDSANQTAITNDTVVAITASQEIYAQWQANTNTKFTVNYYYENLDDEEFPEVANYTQTGYGETDTAITINMLKALTDSVDLSDTEFPVVEGFTVNEGRIVLANINANGETVINVYYERNEKTLTITRDTNTAGVVVEVIGSDGLVIEEDSLYISSEDEGIFTVRYGTTLRITASFMDGYEFSNFAVTPNTITLVNNGDTFDMPDKNVSINVTSKAREFEIIYHANYFVGEQEATTRQNGFFGTELTILPSNTFTRTGYTFVRWNTYPDGNGDNFEAGSSYTMATYQEVIELYAVWEANTYDLTIDWSDRGINQAEITVKIDNVEQEEIPAEVKYGQVIEITIPTTAIVNGYDFTSIAYTMGVEGQVDPVTDENTTDPTETIPTVMTITVTGDLEIVITATAKDDSQIKVVYALRNVDTEVSEGEKLSDTYDLTREEIINGATTYAQITQEYISSLKDSTGGSALKEFEGFFYANIDDDIDSSTPNGNFRVIYNNNITEESDPSTYTTVYILYERYHYGLKLNEISEGSNRFDAEGVVTGSVNHYTQGGYDEYRVKFGAQVNIYLNILTGYDFAGFTVTAVETTGLVSGDADPGELENSHVLLFEQAADAPIGVGRYYYTEGEVEHNVLNLTYVSGAGNETGYYVISAMPNYYLDFKANVSPKKYKVIYHRNWGDETVITAGDTAIFNDPYTFSKIDDSQFTSWARDGWDFAGWAIDANGRTIVLAPEDEYTVTFDNSFAQYSQLLNNQNELHLYAHWTAGEADYTIEYYFEQLNGKYVKHEYDRVITSTTNEHVSTNGSEGVLIMVDGELVDEGGIRTGYEVYTDHTNAVMDGTVLEDNSLVLKVYYRLRQFTLTLTSNGQFTALSASAKEYTLTGGREETQGEPVTSRTYTVQVKYGASVTISATPRSGYVLSSYRVTLGGVNVPIENPTFTMPLSNVNIEAIATPETYTLTFSAGEGEGTMPPQEFEFEVPEAINRNNGAITRQGYTFAGWTINGQEYGDGDTFTFTDASQKTLEAVAKWTPATANYTINFQIQGTTLTEENTVEVWTASVQNIGTTESEITSEMANALLSQALQRVSGHTYVQGEEKFFTFKNFLEGDNVQIEGDGLTTITAVYTRNLVTYNIGINAESVDGISGMTASYLNLKDGQMVTTENLEELEIEVHYGVEVTLTPTFESGYQFGTILRYIQGEDGETLDETFRFETSGNSYIFNNGINESARYEISASERTFTFTYNENFKGGVNGSVESNFTLTSDPITYLSPIELRTTSPWNHQGYNFKGWAETPTISSDAELLPTTISSYIFDDWNNNNIYAIWEANSYEIQYRPSSETVEGEMENTSAVYDKLVTIATSTFERDGYTFNGWAFAVSVDGEGNNVATKVDSISEITTAGLYYVESTVEDETVRTYYGLNLINVDNVDNDNLVVLYPVWRPLTYKVILHFDETDKNGTIQPIEITATYGVLVELPLFNSSQFENWTNTGYDFYGWTYQDMEGETQTTPIRTDDPTTETFSFMNLRNVEGAEVHFYVNWSAGETNYTVYMVQQDTSGNYTLREQIEGFDFVAMTNSTLTPYEVWTQYIQDSETEYASVEGFTVQSTGHNAQSVTIQPTGTVIEIYYSRNYYRLYLNNGAGVSSSSVVLEGTAHVAVDEDNDRVIDYYNIFFEAQVTFADPVLLDGYETPIIYASENAEITNNQILKMPSNNVRVTITATPKTNTPYQVNIYLADENGSFENEDGEEVVDRVVPMTGTTDEPINIEALRATILEDLGEELNLNNYAFSRNTGDTTIKGDETSIVNLYYTRNQYRVSYSTNDSRGLQSYPLTSSLITFGRPVEVTFTLNEGYSLSEVALTITIVSEDEEINGQGYELDYDLVPSEVQVEDRTLMQYTLTFNMPTENINIQINVEADEVEYKVVYRYQDVNLRDEGGQILFDSSLEQSETKYALTNSEITRESLGFTNNDGNWTIDSGKDGFIYSSSTLDGGSVYVNGNGTTVIYINFVREVYTFHLAIEQGLYTGGLSGSPTVTIQGVVKTADITTNTWSVAYGQEVIVTFGINDGFVFDHATVTGTSEYTLPTEETLTLEFTMQQENVEGTIYINPDERSYSVVYYLQNVDVADFDAQDPENYTVLQWLIRPTAYTSERFDMNDIRTMYIEGIESVEGDKTYDDVKDNFIGFNFDDWWFNGSYLNGDGERITTDIGSPISVMANGSTTINIYINRRVVNVSINIDNSNRIDNNSVEGRKDYLYGDVVTVQFNTKPGYLFDYLMVNNTTEIRDGDANLTVTYDEELNIDTVIYEFTIIEEVLGDSMNIIVDLFSKLGTADYTIRIYHEVIVQNIGQPETQRRYEYEDTLIENVETDSLIDYKEYTVAEPGYYYDEFRAPQIPPTVLGDSSTIVEIYFMLQTYTFSIYVNEGIGNVGVYSNYNSLATIDEGSAIRRYQVYYTDLIGFEVTTNYGFIFTGISLKVGDGDYAEENNSTSPDYRLQVPASDFEVEITAIRAPVTISYYPNFEPNTPIYVGASFGETIHLRENTFVRDGYTFLGWATTEENALNGFVEYEDGEEYTISTTDSITFYAVWQAEQSMPWWIWLIIGLVLLLLIIIIIIIIIVVKKKKEKEKIRSR